MAYHVLIAEDEEVTREAVRTGLSALLPGADIHAVNNGVEAVSCAGRWDIGIAFLDIRMPEMNGITAAQKIRKMQPDAQLVFLTAYDDFEYVRSALKLDVVDYLLKPFDQGTLADAVQKVMKRMGAKAGWPAEEGEGLELHGHDGQSRWMDGQTVEALLAGRLSPAWIPAGTCGCVVAMTVADDTQLQRLRHMLTGLDMGGDIRCLAGRKDRYLILAAWSMARETLQEQMKKQMDMLAARLGRQFGIRLQCGISGVFLDDGDIPEACLDAFCQMWGCTGQETVRASAHVMQGDLMEAITDAGLSDMPAADAGQVCALFPDASDMMCRIRTEKDRT